MVGARARPPRSGEIVLMWARQTTARPWMPTRCLLWYPPSVRAATRTTMRLLFHLHAGRRRRDAPPLVASQHVARVGTERALCAPEHRGRAPARFVVPRPARGRLVYARSAGGLQPQPGDSLPLGTQRVRVDQRRRLGGVWTCRHRAPERRQPHDLRQPFVDGERLRRRRTSSSGASRCHNPLGGVPERSNGGVEAAGAVTGAPVRIPPRPTKPKPAYMQGFWAFVSCCRQFVVATSWRPKGDVPCVTSRARPNGRRRLRGGTGAATR